MPKSMCDKNMSTLIENKLQIGLEETFKNQNKLYMSQIRVCNHG